ncbi:MAG: hypothetical protein PHW31_01660 [Candidatus Pacebacteria bacterium]|nr:hypothetical protein [Candidatus Paceibacterota bacterium]
MKKEEMQKIARQMVQEQKIHSCFLDHKIVYGFPINNGKFMKHQGGGDGLLPEWMPEIESCPNKHCTLRCILLDIGFLLEEPRRNISAF